jgi:SAM-dependent methyltransferase
MRLRLLDWIACPACGDDLRLDIARSERITPWTATPRVPSLHDDEVRVHEGTLTCAGCGATYPVTAGVPRLLVNPADAGPATGHRWTRFDTAVPAYEEHLRELVAPLGPDDLLGKRVLDAGCGFGRHAFYAARWGAEVVAVDSSTEAVASAAENLAGHDHAHLVQGDLARPPFKPASFDVAMCFGVLHHVTDPRAVFRALDALLVHGGRLLTSVHGPRQGLVRIATGALRGATAELSPEQLHRVCQAVAGVLRVVSHTPHRALRHVPVAGDIVTHLPVHDHSRWPFDIVVADIYDRLRVPLTGTYTGEALEKWYAEAGYADIEVTRRVRNTEGFVGRGVKR